MTAKQTEKYNMTEETRAGDFNRLLFTPVLVVGMTANLFIVFKISKKHWNNLLPVHLHQISFFSDFFLLTSTGLITAWSVREETIFSVFILLCLFFARINFIVDILHFQLDRLLAIMKPYYHRSKVTITLSSKIVLATKIFTILVVTLSSIFDPGLVLHNFCYRCIFVRPSSVFLHSVPSLLCFLITSVVSIIASTKMFCGRKEESKRKLNVSKEAQPQSHDICDGSEVTESVEKLSSKGIGKITKRTLGAKGTNFFARY